MSSSTGNPEFCLSGRVFERSYAENALSLEAFFRLAARNGFTRVELRDSQIGIDASADEIDHVNALAEEHHIPIELITARQGRLDDERGYVAFTRYLELARNIDCAQIKVSGNDHRLLWKAADEAANHGVRIGTNNHIGTVWETKAGTREMLRRIGHPNFHCLFDPSHLWLMGEQVDDELLEAVFDRISYVILQDYVTGDGVGFAKLGARSVRPAALRERGEVGYPRIIRELAARNYAGAYGVVWVEGGMAITPDSLDLKRQCELMGLPCDD